MPRLMLHRFSEKGTIMRFSGNLFGDPPFDEGGPQLCDVAGPGLKGGEPGSQNLKKVLDGRLRIFWCPAFFKFL